MHPPNSIGLDMLLLFLKW